MMLTESVQADERVNRSQVCQADVLEDILESRIGIEDRAGGGGVALYRSGLPHGSVHPTSACTFYAVQPVRHTRRLSTFSHPQSVGESQRNRLYSMVEFRARRSHGHPGMPQHGRSRRTDRGGCSCAYRRRLNRARATEHG